jgi:hypothetical protein
LITARGSCPIQEAARDHFLPDHFSTLSRIAVNTFDELVAGRREWIEHVLKPWCRSASLADLKRAELDWADLAGRIDPRATLWTWAWSRFPVLVHERLPGVDETHEVQVTLKNGAAHVGYPDNRKTEGGRLVLLSTSSDLNRRLAESGPLSIDEIAKVERLVAL